MLRLLPLAVLLALPFSAQAQMATYCNGRVTAENFTSNRSGTRMDHRVNLLNRTSGPVSFLLTYRGALIDKPINRSFQIPGAGRLQVPLGYQTIVGAGQALMPTQLAENVTISCS